MPPNGRCRRRAMPPSEQCRQRAWLALRSDKQGTHLRADVRHVAHYYHSVILIYRACSAAPELTDRYVYNLKNRRGRMRRYDHQQMRPFAPRLLLPSESYSDHRATRKAMITLEMRVVFYSFPVDGATSVSKFQNLKRSHSPWGCGRGCEHCGRGCEHYQRPLAESFLPDAPRPSRPATSSAVAAPQRPPPPCHRCCKDPPLFSRRRDEHPPWFRRFRKLPPYRRGRGSLPLKLSGPGRTSPACENPLCSRRRGELPSYFLRTKSLAVAMPRRPSPIPLALQRDSPFLAAAQRASPMQRRPSPVLSRPQESSPEIFGAGTSIPGGRGAAAVFPRAIGAVKSLPCSRGAATRIGRGRKRHRTPRAHAGAGRAETTAPSPSPPSPPSSSPLRPSPSSRVPPPPLSPLGDSDSQELWLWHCPLGFGIRWRRCAPQKMP